MAFCPKCATQLRQPPLKNQPNDSSTGNPKPMITLVNGIFIGVSVAGVVVSLVGAFSLNASDISISSVLRNNGVLEIGQRFALRDVVSLLSICFFGVDMGFYVLAVGFVESIQQKSARQT
jgi:hypothetical protein